VEDKYLEVSKKPFIQLRHKYFQCLDERYQNRTIIMIPGWLDSIEARTPLIESFQRYANIIIYEPRGFGKSSKPHKRGIWGVEEFTDDLSKVIELYNLKDDEFFIWGSCIGSALSYLYYLTKNGVKPKGMLSASPESKFKTKWWFNVLKLLPYPLLWLAQKLVVFVLRIYLKFKTPKETANLDYALKRFKEAGLYIQLRILVEFIHKYDIRGREKGLDLPILVLIAEQDWFTDPENSKLFATLHPKSKLIRFGDAHRIIVGNHEIIGDHVKDFIDILE